MNELNWGNARLVPSSSRLSIFGGSIPIDEEKQKYYQERYGDDLTKAIKMARHNQRREQFRRVL